MMLRREGNTLEDLSKNSVRAGTCLYAAGARPDNPTT